MVSGTGPHVDLQAAMVTLGEMEIGSILLEGGGTLNGAMLESGLVDRVILFFAPKIVGGGTEAKGTFVFPGVKLMKDAISLEGLEVKVLGDNVCISGTPVLTKL